MYVMLKRYYSQVGVMRHNIFGEFLKRHLLNSMPMYVTQMTSILRYIDAISYLNFP
jgi:hypothetical protein